MSHFHLQFPSVAKKNQTKIKNQNIIEVISMQRFAEGDCLPLQHAAQLRKKKKKPTKQPHIQPLNITYIHCLISKIINLQR